MKRIKDTLTKILNNIKNSNLVKLIKFKAIIKGLNEKIGELGEEKQILNSEIIYLNNKIKKLSKTADKAVSLQIELENTNKTMKIIQKDKKDIEERIVTLETELFNKELELKQHKIQEEEYKAQIEDLKSDRYLIKKVPTGRTKNTIKTKISRPMSAKVTKYMRGEHE